jgi:hypothetical protein
MTSLHLLSRQVKRKLHEMNKRKDPLPMIVPRDENGKLYMVEALNQFVGWVCKDKVIWVEHEWEKWVDPLKEFIMNLADAGFEARFEAVLDTKPADKDDNNPAAKTRGGLIVRARVENPLTKQFTEEEQVSILKDILKRTIELDDIFEEADDGFYQPLSKLVDAMDLPFVMKRMGRSIVDDDPIFYKIVDRKRQKKHVS